MLPQSLNRI